MRKGTSRGAGFKIRGWDEMSSLWERLELAGLVNGFRTEGRVWTLGLTGLRTSRAHVVETRPPCIGASSEEPRARRSLSKHTLISLVPVCGVTQAFAVDYGLGRVPGVHTESEHPRKLNRRFRKAPWTEEERRHSQIPPVSSNPCVFLNPDQMIVDVARIS